ncbi:MAG: DODA-type extradiol aromatic ring-opening family dioxygenase [Chloroflexota bacterium]
MGLGASHSPILFVSPDKWLARVHEGQALDDEPPSFKLSPENVAHTNAQIQRCHAAYAELRAALEQARPDALVILGDDQGENFNATNMPLLSIYTGDEVEGSFGLGRRLPVEQQEDLRRAGVPCDGGLAELILQECVEGGLDLASSRQLPGEGLGHAHMWPLRYLTPALDLPIVPIFINAYFPPQPAPERCYLLGRLVEQAIRKSHKRVAVFGSGGLSHFPRHLGSWGIPPYPVERRWHIDEAFDRRVLQLMVEGMGRDVASLTSAELTDAGNLELRNWIALSGALGDRPGRILTYEPVYTVAIGLAFAVWAERDDNSQLAARRES